MNVLKQIKIVDLLKMLVEEKFNQDLIVSQYGFSIIISPRNVDEIKEIIRELAEAEKEELILEFEKQREFKEMELEQELEREFEYEVEV